MFNPRHRLTQGSLGVGLVAVVVSTALALTAQPVNAAPRAERGHGTTVAHTDQGTMTSRITGRTATGQRVTGTFTPLRVARKHGELMVKGVVQGVVHEAGGATSTFTTIDRMPVKSINGQPLNRGAAKSAVSGRASCQVLNLVLGPLHLDLLGLQVDLNQVVLRVIAVTGAGNLLGNLLCAITGLLDGTPLAGLLGQIADLLNQILAALRLG